MAVPAETPEAATERAWALSRARGLCRDPGEFLAEVYEMTGTGAQRGAVHVAVLREVRS